MAPLPAVSSEADQVEVLLQLAKEWNFSSCHTSHTPHCHQPMSGVRPQQGSDDIRAMTHLGEG